MTNKNRNVWVHVKSEINRKVVDRTEHALKIERQTVVTEKNIDTGELRKYIEIALPARWEAICEA